MAGSLMSVPKIWIGPSAAVSQELQEARWRASKPLRRWSSRRPTAGGALPLALVLEEHGEDMLLQRLEGLWIPEERGDMDEDVLVEGPRFVGGLLEELHVVLQVLHAAQRHPAGEPPLEGGRLVFAEVDPTALRTREKSRWSIPSSGACRGHSASAVVV